MAYSLLHGLMLQKWMISKSKTPYNLEILLFFSDIPTNYFLNWEQEDKQDDFYHFASIDG